MVTVYFCKISESVREEVPKVGASKDIVRPLRRQVGRRPTLLSVATFLVTEADLRAIKYEELVSPEDLCRNCRQELSVGNENKKVLIPRVEPCAEKGAFEYRFHQE